MTRHVVEEEGFRCLVCGAEALEERAEIARPNGHWDADNPWERRYRCARCGAMHGWEQRVTRVGLYGDNDETESTYWLESPPP
jgi:hypothetical protein